MFTPLILEGVSHSLFVGVNLTDAVWSITRIEDFQMTASFCMEDVTVVGRQFMTKPTGNERRPFRLQRNQEITAALTPT